VYELELVRRILSGIAGAGERYGRRKIAAMLVGDTSELPPALARLSTTVALSQEQSETIGRWIDAAVAAGLIAMSKDQYRTLSLTAPGREVMRGRAENLRITRPAKTPGLSSWRRFRGHRSVHRRRGPWSGDDW
jgi:hypothetical protein